LPKLKFNHSFGKVSGLFDSPTYVVHAGVSFLFFTAVNFNLRVYSQKKNMLIFLDIRRGGLVRRGGRVRRGGSKESQIFFTQIYAEKTRRLVRRVGCFWFRYKFFGPACRRQGLAPLREKKKIEYTSVKGQANPVSRVHCMSD
jgi:hypothetical protein